jgi:hypothetical protein
LDDSEIDVDVGEEEDVQDQLGHEPYIQTTLEPEYGAGEREPTPLEQEGMSNGAKYNYTVYYQEQA